MSSDNYIPGEAHPLPAARFHVATAGTRDSTGTTLLFDGQTEYTTKHYKRLAGVTISSGSRVLVLEIAGTYVLLGNLIT